MRPIQIQPLSLVAGAVIVGAAFLFAANGSTPSTSWPPPKAMILNVFEDVSPPITIPSGGSHTILTVPADQWLTITGASAFAVSTLGNAPNLTWVEVRPGGPAIKKGVAVAGWPSDLYGQGWTRSGAPEATPSACGGPLGWTFSPGSTLELRNVGALAQSLSCFSLLGYYSRN